MRVLFHVQHLVGVGHLQRAARLTRALRARRVSVDLAIGGVGPASFDWAGATAHHLPPLTAAVEDFAALRTADGRPPDAKFWAIRRDILTGLVARLTPDLLLVEGYPFARRAFRHELDPTIAAARASGAKVAVSLRDILVHRDDPARAAEVHRKVAADIDRVLVHGDPAVIALDATFPVGPIAEKLTYTGYVGPDRAPAMATDRAGVVVSVGGGAAGFDLVRAALSARPATRAANAPWTVVCGPAMPATLVEALRAEAAADGVAILATHPDLPALFGCARLSISQAGYNTVAELLVAGPRRLLVPFERPGETEQRTRADLLAARDEAVVMTEDADVTALAAAIDRAWDGPAPATRAPMDGAARAAAALVELAA
jgi:predicted glycosyltransferase